MGVGGGGGSQRLISFNLSTVLVVLLLGLWLLLGCNESDIFDHINDMYKFLP